MMMMIAYGYHSRGPEQAYISSRIFENVPQKGPEYLIIGN